MKKHVLVISLLTLSGVLIGSATPTPQYRLSGKQAVDYLVKNGDCVDCDLSNQDLRAIIAVLNRKYSKQYIIMELADKEFIDLSGGNLSHVNLSDTDLRYVQINGANLTDANLTNANLSLKNTMWNVHMTGVNLTNANMIGVTMHNVNMTD